MRDEEGEHTCALEAGLSPDDQDLRDQIKAVLEDYRAGLLDGVEDGVEAILAIPRIEEALRFTPIQVMETRKR